MLKDQQKFSAHFFILVLILSATFCFLFLENFKSYTSRITILFIPKNETAAIQSEQVARNLTELPRNLSFYEKLLADSEDIQDEFAGYTKDKRKKLWNKKLEIEHKKNSGIIEIEISGDNQIKSEKIARQTAFTFFNTASRYYNIKNEIDLRIIDGPIAGVKIKNWPWLISLSVLVGTFFSFLIAVISSKLSKFLLNCFGFVLNRFRRQKFSSQVETIREKEKEEMEVMADYPLFTSPEKPISPEKKSQAPDNLPVSGKPESQAEKISTDESDIRKETRLIKEPSEEELKERLNQLLRGEL